MTARNFWQLAEREPDRVAVVEADGREIRAGQLLASANQLVHALRQLGLKRGDSIAAVLPNSVEAFEVYLAMQQAGWYLTPINFHLVGPEIAYILQDCEAKVLIGFLGTRIAKFKLPRSIDFTDALPRDPNGKLYKRKLREAYWAGRQRAI